MPPKKTKIPVPASPSPVGATNSSNADNQSDEICGGGCGVTVTNEVQAIFCSRCKKWCCISCLKMPNGDYEFYMSSQFLQNQPSFCLKCQPVAIQAVESGALIDEKVAAAELQLTRRISELSDSIAQKADKTDLLSLESRVQALEKRNSHACDKKLVEIEKDIASLSRQYTDLLNEPLDIAHRSKNVIARNIPEQTADGTSTDGAKAQEILTEIECSDRPALTRRLGAVDQTGARARPLLLRFNDTSSVDQVLENAKKLASAGQEWKKKVYLDRDRTRLEAQRRKNHIERIDKQVGRLQNHGKDAYRKGTRIFYNSNYGTGSVGASANATSGRGASTDVVESNPSSTMVIQGELSGGPATGGGQQ